MSDFLTFARQHGVLIDPAKFAPSQKIRRCGTASKPRSDNGAWFWDGERGWVMDWSGEARCVWYKDPHAKPLSDDDRRQYALRKRLAEDSQRAQYEKAAEVARQHLSEAVLKYHDYLKKKKHGTELGFVREGKLLIPMRNVLTNRLQGYQAISWDVPSQKFEKKMLHGMKAKGGVFVFGDIKSDEKWLVEGYATGLSVKAALQSAALTASVVVCFSARNLVQVAQSIGGTRFIFADNDESRTGENCALETELPYAMADQVGWDANDMFCNLGVMDVVKKIIDCRVKAQKFW